jgi:adenylate kinase family enzyme
VNRVLVLGSSGAGKSTLAQRLGEALDLEVIHLDSYYWQPNWTSTPPAEWACQLNRLLGGERWVMDGNYPDSLALRLARADAVVFIDRNRLLCLWRCIRRYLKHRGHNRPELAPGCYEKLDWDFLQWIWNYPRDVRPKVLEAIARSGQQRTAVILRNERETAAFLGSLKGA